MAVLLAPAEIPAQRGVHDNRTSSEGPGGRRAPGFRGGGERSRGDGGRGTGWRAPPARFAGELVPAGRPARRDRDACRSGLAREDRVVVAPAPTPAPGGWTATVPLPPPTCAACRPQSSPSSAPGDAASHLLPWATPGALRAAASTRAAHRMRPEDEKGRTRFPGCGLRRAVVAAGVSPRGTSAAARSGSGGAACAGPWPRSGGCAHG